MTIFDTLILAAAAIVVILAGVALFEGLLVLTRNILERFRNRSFETHTVSRQASETK